MAGGSLLGATPLQVICRVRVLLPDSRIAEGTDYEGPCIAFDSGLMGHRMDGPNM